MATYLDRILARHREVATLDTRPIDTLIADARAMPPARDFPDALRSGEGLQVIAEIKRRSPSKGDLHADLDPADIARRYEQGGAACLSVLTDVEHFGGSADDLRAARAACSLPVLRKDFTVSPRDVCDARAMGADCLLLIAAALEPGELADLHALAVDVGLHVLVEIHDEPELAVAIAAGARLVGVNQRDLVTFEVDHARAVRMASIIPDDVVKVAESGVRDRADAASLQEAGYHAVLVGETLVTASDPTRAIRQLRGLD
ncbi:MAG: indole-3-glycerol phosphate synthase TrpC [Ilumatobacteraceae bacterium]